jgi:penicillin G amidase
MIGIAPFVILTTAGLLFALTWFVVRQSLPMIRGELVIRGAKTMVTIDRDDRGVSTVHATDHEDLAFGLGFVHGQDRFFQMDGLRRYAAGELAEILGPGPKEECIAWDRQVRVQRFRSVARQGVSAPGRRGETSARCLRVGRALGT